jgi:hypothetical protein
LIGELGAGEVALLGGSCGGPPAITYAARHPERVRRLVLYGAYVCGPRLAPLELQQAMVALVRAHWGLGSKALTDLFAPGHTTEERQRLATQQREAAAPETAAALLELIYRMDVSDVVGGVRVPTLVIHRQGDRAIGFENGRDLAAQLPGATFVPLAGDAHLPWLGDWAAVAEATLAFLVPGTARTGAAPMAAREENALVRAGDVWTVAFGGRQAHLKHARGLVDLALLLARPGEEVAAAELMEGVDAAGRAHGPVDPVLDEQARVELRERVQTLDERIAAAEQAGAVQAAERAAEEREALLRELRAATGLGGRRRALADPAERARKAVSGRIRESIDKLRGVLPELARHLDASITTGTFCCYAPEPPTVWRTT